MSFIRFKVLVLVSVVLLELCSGTYAANDGWIPITGPPRMLISRRDFNVNSQESEDSYSSTPAPIFRPYFDPKDYSDQYDEDHVEPSPTSKPDEEVSLP